MCLATSKGAVVFWIGDSDTPLLFSGVCETGSQVISFCLLVLLAAR